MTLPKLPARHHFAIICMWAEGHPVYWKSPVGTWHFVAGPQFDDWGTYAIKLENHFLLSEPSGLTLNDYPINQPGELPHAKT